MDPGEFTQDDIQTIAAAARPLQRTLPAGIARLLVGLLWVVLEPCLPYRFILNNVPVSWLCVFLGFGLLLMRRFLMRRALKIEGISVIDEGVRNDTEEIRWDQIDRIFGCLTSNSPDWPAFGGPTYWRVFLRLETRDGRAIRIDTPVANPRSAEVTQSYRRLMHLIVSKTEQRHLEKLAHHLRADGVVQFGNFALRREGMFPRGYRSDAEPLPLHLITGYSISRDGMIHLEYREDTGEVRKASIGHLGRRGDHRSFFAACLLTILTPAPSL